MSITTASIITLLRGAIDDLLKTDGLSTFVYDADNSFKLNSDHVVESSIIVYQNGTELPESEWGYNSDTNKITITFTLSGYSLTKGDNILITFNHYERFSDTELTSYIKSSLMEFTKRQYKKTFYMNDSNQVVTLNGTNPTFEEGNIIALVTAIKIDPKNIKISTRDFNISPEEFRSASEQIDHLFQQFNLTLGIVDFFQEDLND
jgi:hypothetical protein